MGRRMRCVPVRLPDEYLEAIDQLVASGLYISRPDVIREAVRQFVPAELRRLQTRG